ncbi:two-component system cell cycle response regulator DivK [Sphingomonas naasensis]|uniref:Response regulator n=1 Tax=Sphingomonas naasensis TaxID=1344951 RepID=A0A4S1WGH6_9SPHN|nr:two-component system cell cycle response regulator DivK [Sphingomonas naasensis]TGX41355.1 response regulator [Sphingomonas naasensis]
MAKRVLVVEDNELNLKLFCDLLRAHDFAAEPVADGREAVARAHAFTPDLIVMDIQMPHVTGYDLIREMKADPGLRAIPIMAVTAYAGHDDEERIRAAGANAYVSKPISLVRFIEEVRALVPERPAPDAGEDEAPDDEAPEEETSAEEAPVIEAEDGDPPSGDPDDTPPRTGGDLLDP